jgi:hypothetical protein
MFVHVMVVLVHMAFFPLFLQVSPGVFRLLAPLAMALSFPSHSVLGLVDTLFAFVVCH